MHASQQTADVGGIGAGMPVMPGQLELHRMSRRDMEKLLGRFRHWLDSEWAGGATVIPIEAVRSYFGWPRK